MVYSFAIPAPSSSLYFWSMSLIILVSHVLFLLNQITSQLCKKPSRSLKSEKLSLDTSFVRTCFPRHCTFIDSWNAHKSINDLISDLQFNYRSIPMAYWMLTNSLRRWNCNRYLRVLEDWCNILWWIFVILGRGDRDLAKKRFYIVIR